MNFRTYTALFAFLLFITACKKDQPVTRVVEFKETTYQTLGTFTDAGKPNYLLPKDEVSPNLLSFVREKLPDQDLRKTNPELLRNSASADISITQSSDVFITFLSQGSLTLMNTLGFYTYPTNNPPTSPNAIKTITYVFPHAGAATPLEAGDRVKIGRFEPGTSIGFVLLQNAWTPSAKNINTKVPHFTSSDALNPEVDPNLKRHVVLLNYTPENKVLIGFEDLDRTSTSCDHDFNDLVIYATINR